MVLNIDYEDIFNNIGLWLGILRTEEVEVENEDYSRLLVLPDAFYLKNDGWYTNHRTLKFTKAFTDWGTIDGVAMFQNNQDGKILGKEKYGYKYRVCQYTEVVFLSNNFNIRFESGLLT